MKQTIFISHSTTNDAIVDTIAAALKGADFDVWVDHANGIEPGMPNWDKCEETSAPQRA